jgi:hypothetical protein
LKRVLKPGHGIGLELARGYSARRCGLPRAVADKPAGPRPGGPVQPRRRPTAWEWGARDGGVARLVRVVQWTRCLGNGGVSTVGAVVMRLMRWQRRWLTRAMARRARVERRRRDDVQRWRRRSGDRWCRWRGPIVLEEKGEGEAYAN